jgi:transcriptional regulator with XRE-family HTH domain
MSRQRGVEMASGLLTGEAIKAARLLIGWSQYDLACEARISSIAVYAVEHGYRMSDWILLSMREALEGAGIEFSEGVPPQLRPNFLSILKASIVNGKAFELRRSRTLEMSNAIAAAAEENRDEPYSLARRL